MKLSSWFSSFLLLGSTTTTDAFTPRVFQPRASSSLCVATDPTVTTTKAFDLEQPPISPFGKGQDSETNASKKFLGGKGANLAVMSNIGLAVPPGFTITTECCSRYCSDWNQELPEDLWKLIKSSLQAVEEEMKAEFGSPENPLLLSVRSGAAISMPGMMDTVLNLGMNDQVVRGLAAKTGNPRFAWDSYRRFLEMFGNVVLGIPRSLFEDELDDVKYEKGLYEDSDLQAEDFEELVTRFKKVYQTMDMDFPQDVFEQLNLAIGAVFQGWMGARAVKYREVENIRNLLGTAVNVQSMVFGNMGDTSGTGVCFTRDPNTGENYLFGEFLIDAQGEDVVAGIRTPKPISELQDVMPELYAEFKSNTEILEKHYGDMQDIEFTFQQGKLFMLQTRTGKRGGEAAVKIAVDLVNEGFVNKRQAVTKVLPEHLDQLLHPRFPDVEMKEYKDNVMTKGLPASPGAAVGRIACSNKQVVENKEKGIPSILVRDEVSQSTVDLTSIDLIYCLFLY
jgi:pyruvate,orthophosphate dikinase